MKILIIEDEKLILKSLEITFTHMGHDISCTTLGAEGLGLIMNNDFDIIITDLMLNDLSGFDILEGSLKKYSRDQIAKKFIIMTAYSSEQIMTRAQNYGCLFISKPFESLRDTVQLIINNYDK